MLLSTLPLLLLAIGVSLVSFSPNARYTIADLGPVPAEGTKIDINDRSEILLVTRSPDRCVLITTESGEKKEREVGFIHGRRRVIPVGLTNSSDIAFRFLDMEMYEYRLLVLSATGEIAIAPVMGLPKLPAGLKILGASTPLVTPEALNDVGTIVGNTAILEFENSTNRTRGLSTFAFRRESEPGWAPLTSDGNSIRRVSDINNNGYAVGVGSSQHAILLDPHGKATNIGSLGGLGNAAAYGINDRLEVVGESSQRRRWKTPGTADRTLTKVGLAGLRDWLRQKSWREHQRHAFLWEKGNIIDLNECTSRLTGWELIEARAINNRGAIVGLGEYKGELHAFLLTPIRGKTKNEE